MEFYRPSCKSQERGGSKQLHWSGSWVFFWLHKTAAGAAVPGQVVTGRDPREGPSGGRQQRALREAPGGSGDAPGGSGDAPGRLRGGCDGSCDPRKAGEQGRAGVPHSRNVGGPERSL